MRLAPLPPPYYTSKQKKRGRKWIIVLLLGLAILLVFLYLKFLRKPSQPVEDDQASIIKNESEMRGLEESEEEIQIPTVEADENEEEGKEKEVDKEEDEILPSAYLANTDNEILSKEKLAKTEISKIELIRDEIYARHGYIFEDMEKQKYFEDKTWYVKNPNYSDALLNDVELKNLEIISEFMKDEPTGE